MAALERCYTMFFNSVTAGSAAVSDLFYIKASATNGLSVRRISLSASGITGAAEMNLRLKRGSGTVTAGSGGSAPAITKVQSRLSLSALSAVRANDTTQSTATTFVTLAMWNWNVLMDFLESPATQEERWEADVSESIVFDIATAPGVNTVISGFIVFEET
jgi:hypothetical protein